jgi:hypothetical protein
VNRHSVGYAICGLFTFAMGAAAFGLVAFALRWSIFYVMPLWPAWNLIKLSASMAREALVEAGWRAPEKKP